MTKRGFRPWDRIEFVADSDVDAALDAELRALLSLSFTKPGDEIFISRRYYLERPTHRWIVLDESGNVVAHTASRPRPVIFADGTRETIAGISEVCVHPSHRGQGLVRRMLACAHDELARRGLSSALLFGDERIYRSSGYGGVRQPLHFWDPRTLRWREEAVPTALARSLTESALVWPSGTVRLRGILF
jgi:predicted N-acetyltransferase YhbS